MAMSQNVAKIELVTQNLLSQVLTHVRKLKIKNIFRAFYWHDSVEIRMLFLCSGKPEAPSTFCSNFVIQYSRLR